MKVIFLDIDGVLNSSDYRRQLGIQYFSEIIDRRKMPLLKEIVDATGAQIVLSTSWRKFWNERGPQLDFVGQYINEVFAEYGLSIYSKTPVIENAGRNEEITAWLETRKNIEAYVVFDDMNFNWSPDICSRFIQTNVNGDGMDADQMQLAIRILNSYLLDVNKKKGRVRKYIHVSFRIWKNQISTNDNNDCSRASGIEKSCFFAYLSLWK